MVAINTNIHIYIYIHIKINKCVCVYIYIYIRKGIIHRKRNYISNSFGICMK